MPCAEASAWPPGRRPRRLNQQQKEPDMNEETKGPQNLRANAFPTDGFVLSIDGKLKARYETSKEATAAGSKLKQSFPAIQVSVYDAAERLYTPLESPEK
jgi:hypothetical protein